MTNTLFRMGPGQSFLDSWPWSMASHQCRQWTQVMGEVQRLPTYSYPWDDLEATLARRVVTDVPIVAYGSLLNAASARRTLPKRIVDLARPVVAAGVRRVFDYIMPEFKTAYGKPLHAKACAALNVHVTRDPSDKVNGILLRLSLDELAAFRDREVDYDLVPVACCDWADPDQPPFSAYILTSETRTDRTLLPHRMYYLVCRRGAADYGEAFLRFWLERTYLGDGKTPMLEWERQAFPDGIP